MNPRTQVRTGPPLPRPSVLPGPLPEGSFEMVAQAFLGLMALIGLLGDEEGRRAGVPEVVDSEVADSEVLRRVRHATARNHRRTRLA